MQLTEIFRRFASFEDATALAWNDRHMSYAGLLREIEVWRRDLRRSSLTPSGIVLLECNLESSSLAALLAILAEGAIAMPILAHEIYRLEKARELAPPALRITFDGAGRGAIDAYAPRAKADHPHFQRLMEAGAPGLVLFTSGTTHEPKGVVHDASRLLSKFSRRGRPFRTVAVMPFDHIGGLDTVFHTLTSGGMLIVPPDRTPDGVAEAVARERAEVLPASPSFLNQLLLGDTHCRHDLSSLRIIAYGAEIMPEPLLRRLRTHFPQAEFLQRYGLSELGALPSRSLSSDSPWLQLGGRGVDTRVVDGQLEVRTETTMLGYLNANAPTMNDGWFPTGDLVEEKDGYIRIVGRAADIINVGGRKINPAAVESVLMDMDEIAAAKVWGEPNVLLGQIVAAEVCLSDAGDAEGFQSRMTEFCRGRLADYMLPRRVVIAGAPAATTMPMKKRRWPQ
jgi:acyl-CoA synthetase (AMP-forming)/AMP-acid ligase II